MAKKSKGGCYVLKPRVYWSAVSAWFSDGATVKDLGRITKAEAVKFCYLNRCLLVTRKTTR
jgi:hypothetical protein